jgi:hypothetical protein
MHDDFVSVRQVRWRNEAREMEWIVWYGFGWRNAIQRNALSPTAIADFGQRL